MGLRLGIDLDGVVADFNRGWTAAYNRSFGAKLSPDMVRTWDSPLSLTHFRDMDAFWNWARDQGDDGVFCDLEPYPGAVPALHGLHRDGHRLVIVSAKPDWAVPGTLAWLAEHRIPTREIHFTEAKHEVPCDVYLDDAPGQITDLVRVRSGEAVVCRYVRPWNTPVDGALDVHDWTEFEQTVRRTARSPSADHLHGGALVRAAYR
jgi:5'(3')-deoxyribonucleotidase